MVHAWSNIEAVATPWRTKVYVQGSIGTYQRGSNGLKIRVEIKIVSGAGGGYTP